ncbi:MAG: MBL fold metallo-hydrolase [Nitrolancea sp.]
MRTSRINDSSTQLTRWPLLFPVNVYLVREEDGLTLIDAAVGGSQKGILNAAEQLGAPIVRILLTHAHGDHVGALDDLKAALPDAQVLMTARTARFLSGDRSLDPDEDRGKLPGSFTAKETRPNRLIAPGDRVGSLEVIASPGHSPDHVSYLDVRDRTLFAGDAFQTRAGIAVSGTVRPFFPFPAMATWDKEMALESARQLQALSPRHLAVGHGEFLREPDSRMAAAIAEAERRIGAKVRHAS